MKNYRDMAQSVMRRSELILKMRAKRRKRIKMIGTMALLLIVLFGALYYDNLDNPHYTQTLPTQIGDRPIMNTIVTISPDVPYDVPIIWAEEDDRVDVGEVEWKDKIITDSLYTAFHDKKWSGKEGAFAIGLAFRGYDDQFSHKGKTILEYCLEKDEEEKTINKLTNLIKDGECLKYGETLYSTGTPNGIRWTKELYESVVAQYGKVFLEAYIADGVFFKDKVVSELSKLSERPAEKEYIEAVKAYLLETTQDLQSTLLKKGIVSSTLDLREETSIELGKVTLILYATQEQFNDIVFDELGVKKSDVVFTFVPKSILNQAGSSLVGDLAES